MAFNERLAKKLAKLLVKVGLNEDKAAEIVDEVAVELAEEGNPEVNDPVPPEGDPIPPLPPEEEPSGEPIPQEEPGQEPAPQEVPVPPLPPEGAVPPEVPQEVPGQEVPPEVPPIPQTDPTELEAVKAELEEQKKANEGLLARVDSLEKALKAAGILEGTPESVGVEPNPTLPDAPNGQGAILDEVLKQINNNGH